MNIYSWIGMIILIVTFWCSASIQAHDRQKLVEFCQAVNSKFQGFGEKRLICNPERWTFDMATSGGNPLVYQIFNAHLENVMPTLFLCGIHGDEAPTVLLCINLVRDMIFDNPQQYQNVKIVIAPIVNPDSFLTPNPVRTNARGVDLNRNFPTQDWDLLALQQWQTKSRRDPRRYPGPSAGSEIETIFQIQLIEKFQPKRIVAIHSPYGFLDFDYGEGKKDQQSKEWQQVRELAQRIAKASGSFKVTDFPFFPGSLGNYAGRERKIPTFTLELPGNRVDQAQQYWKRFGPGLMIAAQENEDNLITSKKIADRQTVTSPKKTALKTADN